MKSTIKKPVIVIGCPRSGTTLLFSILSESPELFSMYRESWNALETAYREALLGTDSNSDLLTEDDLSEACKELLLEEFHKFTVNKKFLTIFLAKYIGIRPFNSRFPVKNPILNLLKDLNGKIKDKKFREYRLIEKTPRNCFRIPFMDKLFPDARYVFISRDGRSNISSLIEGWKRNHGQEVYNRFPEPKGEFRMSNFDYKKWVYVLPPNWQTLNEKTLEEVCAFQWKESNRYALDALEKLAPEKYIKIKYEDLIKDSPKTISQIANFIEVPYEGRLKYFAEKPPVVSTPLLDRPKADKWKKNEEAINRIMPMLECEMERLGYASSVTNK
jgi:hypothetical protein